MTLTGNNQSAEQNTRFFRVGAEDFKKIPGSPIAYWASSQIGNIFLEGASLISLARPCQGMATTNNSLFVRHWYEVSIAKSCFAAHSEDDALASGKKWFPYNKGGEFRKWYGNAHFLLNYENKGKTICDYIDNTPNVTVKSNGRVINRERFFLESISWSKISSGNIAIRYFPPGFIFDVAGCSIFASHDDLCLYLGFMNSKVCRQILSSLSPTVNFEVGQINILPILNEKLGYLKRPLFWLESLITIAQEDWDSYETSWDFQSNPLLVANAHCCEPGAFNIAYLQLREEWRMSCEAMRKLEVENNRIFIEAYGLQDELSPEVPWNEITLTCNPWYRYGKAPATVNIDGREWIVSSKDCPVNMDVGLSDEGTAHVGLPNGKLPADEQPFNQDLEQRLLEDTVKEFISYAVGCMMGRYSPEKPGLVFAGGEFSDQWSVISDQLSGGSGQKLAGSSQRSVVGGQCYRNEAIEKYVREELSRVAGLAEKHGVGDGCLPTGEAIAQGGDVCVGNSNPSCGGVDSVQHRRGTGAKLYEGIRELPLDSQGLQRGSGNPTYDLCSPEILRAIANHSGVELVQRGWKDAERIDWEAIHQSLITDHFAADKDGVIPILDDEWFMDDIVAQFKAFLTFTFGEEHFAQNLRFIEGALGKDLRKYFMKDFYKEHVQRYKKRPIYWLFSSPKGSFNALIYMHRYRPDTVSIVLNDYLREYITKLAARREHLIAENNRADLSGAARTRNLKLIDKYASMLAELEAYERDILFPLAQKKIVIDLDDGVKVNYCKFGDALRKIPGLEAKEE